MKERELTPEQIAQVIVSVKAFCNSVVGDEDLEQDTVDIDMKDVTIIFKSVVMLLGVADFMFARLYDGKLEEGTLREKREEYPH